MQAQPKMPSSPGISAINQFSGAFPSSSSRFLTLNDNIPGAGGYQQAFSSASFKAFVKVNQGDEAEPKKKTRKSKKKGKTSDSESEGQSSEGSEGSAKVNFLAEKALYFLFQIYSEYYVNFLIFSSVFIALLPFSHSIFFHKLT